MIQNYNAEKVEIIYNPISLLFKEVTLLSREEYLENKELIPLINEIWWLRSPGYYYDDAASVDYDGSLDRNYINNNSVCVRPALKIAHCEQLTPGDKIKIQDLYFTVLNSGILLCDTVVGNVMFDNGSNDYDVSFIKLWLESWAEMNGITFENSEEITLLSKDEYFKNKELIPLVKGGWWLCSQGDLDDLAAYVSGRSGGIRVTGCYVGDTLGVRPALKIEHYEHLKPGEKVIIKDLSFTILNDGILLCDTIVSKVMFDETSNNYDTSYIKTWLENWAQENNITFKNH